MAFKINPISDSVENIATTSLVSHQWKSVRIEFSNGDESTMWGARGIEFETTVDTSVVKGLKDATIMNSTYNKTYSGSLTVLQTEIERWYSANDDLRKYSLVDFDKFNIIITLPSNVSGTPGWSKTTLKGCRFLNDPRKYNQTEGEPEVTLNLSISGIVMEELTNKNPDA
jgi:hypothetical protein